MRLIKYFFVLQATYVCFAVTDAVQITINTSKAPDLHNFGQRVKHTCEDWFHRVSKLLYSPRFIPPRRINIFFDPNYDGAAKASGENIVGSVRFFRKNPNDVGAMIHEMAHVIQGYRKCDFWVTEGIADWIRYYHYEPNRKPSKPSRNDSYKKGYATAAYFLNWINKRYRKYSMIYYLNKDCREGIYNSNIFQRLTGKNADQLWQEMLQS